jgi:sporulation protein YlmC with PRC-barrel domain
MATLEGQQLYGKTVVDVTNGESVGSVADILVDSAEGRVAGLVVSHGNRLSGRQRDEVIPAEAVQAVGRDAVTVNGAGSGAVEAPKRMAAGGTLARSSAIKGRRIVTTSGREVGRLGDVVLDCDTGSVAGYTIRAGPLEGALGHRDPGAEYIKADPDIRFGEDVVVVPDGTVMGPAEQKSRDAMVSVRWTGVRQGSRPPAEPTEQRPS